MLRFFSRPRQQPDVTAWWREANALALAPTAEGVAALKTSALPMTEAPDLAEAQQEMLESFSPLVHTTSTTFFPS